MYAQFMTLSTGYIKGTIPPVFGEPYPIEACGDRGIVKIDGRLSKQNTKEKEKLAIAFYHAYKGK